MGRSRSRRRPRWLAGRLGLTPTVRIAIMAAAISVAKVALFVVGTGTFLAAYRAEDLAWLYLGLALVAGSASLLLAPHLESARADISLGWLLAVSAALTAGRAPPYGPTCPARRRCS